MVSDPSTGTSRPKRNGTIVAALWVLGAIAMLELILAAIALAPRVASGLRSGSGPNSAQPSVGATGQSTPDQGAPLYPNRQPQAPFQPSQQSGEMSGDSPTSAPLLGNQQGDRPNRQPPADAAVSSDAALKIVNATLEDAGDGSKKLRVAIKSNPKEQIESTQEKVQVYFYDQDGDEIVPSKAQVSSKWLNWKSGEPQLVEVSYLPETVDPGIKFAGYVIAVYYKGDLQDCRALPTRLQKLFEPKYYIGTEE